VLADKDSHFKIAGQDHPQIMVKAGEPILLAINARKGKTWNREALSMDLRWLRAKDHSKVRAGTWNSRLVRRICSYSAH